MATRDQILSTTEIVSDLELAGEARFGDGEALLAEGRFAGAVYLLGLSAEMWLKVACFRVAGHTPATPASGLFGPATQWMKVNAPSVPHEKYHSLRFWAEYLILMRRVAGSPLSARVAGELRHHVSHRLYQDWAIGLRYRPLPLRESSARRVYSDASWVRNTRLTLRS